MARKKTKSATVKKTKKRTRSMVRRTRRTRTRTVTRRRSSRRSSGVGGIKGIFKKGIVKDVALGVGSGMTTKIVMDRVAPQFSGIASVGAGFLGGGLIGGAVNLFLNGGLSAFGIGGSSQQGGLSV